MEDELDGFLEGNTEDTSPANTEGEDLTQAQGDEQPGDDAAAETDGAEDEGEQPKPKPKSASERIAELTRARRDAEREAAYWRGKAQGSQPQPEQRAEQPQEDAEPDPAAYKYGETDPAYIRDLGKFTARQEFQRLSQETQRRAAIQTVEQTWEQRQADFAKAKPDYFETIDREWVCTPVMADTIKTSDEGAAVAYHLAQHPEEARRIAGMNPLAQIRELGKLEAKLATPAASPPPPKTVSDAPPPAPQARGLSGRFAPPPDTDDLDAFERSFFGSR